MRSLFVKSAARAALAFAATTVATAAVATAAAAQIAPGSTLTFTGTADATDVGLGGVFLNFSPRVLAAASGNTGTFASLNKRGTGVSGHINDIRVGNGPQLIPNFLTLGGYRFTVTSLPPGSYNQDACYIDPVPGQTCTPFQSVQGQPKINAGLSPFSVTNAASANPDGPINSTAAFTVLGTVTGPGGAMSNFTGTISASFIGLPYQYALYTLEQEGLQGLTFTGTFVAGTPILRAAVEDGLDLAVVPEPATYALVAAGLVGVGGVARRRRRA